MTGAERDQELMCEHLRKLDWQILIVERWITADFEHVDISNLREILKGLRRTKTVVENIILRRKKNEPYTI